MFAIILLLTKHASWTTYHRYSIVQTASITASPMLKPRLSASLSECPPSPHVVFSRAAEVGQKLQHDLDNPMLTSLFDDAGGFDAVSVASVTSSQGSATATTVTPARRALTSAFADAQRASATPQRPGAASSPAGSPPVAPRGPVLPFSRPLHPGRSLQSTPSRRLSVAPPGACMVNMVNMVNGQPCPDAHRSVSQLCSGGGVREGPSPLHPAASAAGATSYHSQDSDDEASEAGSEGSDAATSKVRQRWSSNRAAILSQPRRGRLRGVMTWLFDALLADASLEQTNWDQAASVLLPGEASTVRRTHVVTYDMCIMPTGPSADADIAAVDPARAAAERRAGGP